jgi:hypothetical protein
MPNKQVAVVDMSFKTKSDDTVYGKGDIAYTSIDNVKEEDKLTTETIKLDNLIDRRRIYHNKELTLNYYLSTAEGVCSDCKRCGYQSRCLEPMDCLNYY